MEKIKKGYGLDIPSVLHRIIESGTLNEILSFNTTGTYTIKKDDATSRLSIKSMTRPSVSLLSSL